MKYMVLIASTPDGWDALPEDEQRALYGRIGEWWGEHTAAGRIVEGHQLQPADTATTVRIAADGEVAVTDGPFVEAKEFLGGFYLVDVEDGARALELAKQIPDARIPGLAVEVRPVVFADLGND